MRVTALVRMGETWVPPVFLATSASSTSELGA